MIEDIKTELSTNFNLSSGLSYQLFFRFFLHLRILKYATPDILKKISGKYDKIATKNNLVKLEELGYIKNTNSIEYKNVYIATDKVIPAIESLGINKILLPNKSTGKGDINQIGIADVVADILALDNSMEKYFILYPQFPKDKPFIKPDALFVEKKTDKYRLVFLEIEAKKEDWENYVKDKIFNYYDLSKEISVYNYWKKYSKFLNLPCPKVNDFKFSIAFVGTILNYNIDGFSFINNIAEIL
jgi:hypothetical protein